MLAPNMPDYLDVRMLTTLEWVALGHNSQPSMVSKSALLKSELSENRSRSFTETRNTHDAERFINMDVYSSIFQNIWNSLISKHL